MMQQIRLFIVIATAIITAGCVSSKSTTANKQIILRNYTETVVFDKSIPYPTYGVFNWFPENETNNKKSVKDHELIRNAIRQGFQHRSFRLVNRQNVSFYVAYCYKDKPTSDAELNQNYNLNDKKRWRPGQKSPMHYSKNTLIIDIVCKQDHCPRWRGSLQFRMPVKTTLYQKTELINQAAMKLLTNFPPKGVKLLK